jgi:hypothetical protein
LADKSLVFFLGTMIAYIALDKDVRNTGAGNTCIDPCLPGLIMTTTQEEEATRLGDPCFSSHNDGS